MEESRHAQDVYNYYKGSVPMGVGLAIAGPAMSLPTWPAKLIGIGIGGAIIAFSWMHLSKLKLYSKDAAGKEARRAITAEYKIPRIFMHILIGTGLAIALFCVFKLGLNEFQGGGILVGVLAGANAAVSIFYLPQMRKKYNLQR